MTERNVRGFYFCPTHDRPQDWQFLAAWQPAVIRLMLHGSHSDPNSVSVDVIQRLHRTCPEAQIILRVWDVDDRNYEAHEAMRDNPAGEAQKQLVWWDSVISRAHGVPRNQLIAGLNNEVHPDKFQQLYEYTKYALLAARERNLRVGVGVFSVGNPALPGEAEYDINKFAELDPLVVSGNHVWILHEYMQPEGMYAVWTDDQGNERKDYSYLIGRHKRWPIKGNVVIGEWGIEGILYNRHRDPQWGNAGWLNFPQLWSADRYGDEYVACVQDASANVIGICPFIGDWADHRWQSADLLPAYEAFLARKHLCVKKVARPQPTPSTAYVAVPAGANVRSKPIMGDVLTAVPFGARVAVLGYDKASRWFQVEYNGIVGWTMASLLSEKEPERETPRPAPTPQPSDKWRRSIEWVLRWEGGFQDHDNDVGNWTGCAVGQGQKKGTNFGISACSYPQLDIRNLTREQAIAIYERDYWQKSGAAQLEWPYCLLVLDTAILHGVGAAQTWLADVGPDPYEFAARRLRSYTKMANWQFWGQAWVNRVADLLQEMA